MRKIGEVLQQVIEDRGLWHYQAARQLNVSTSTFSRYVTGQATMPDDVLAEAISCFGCEELGQVRCQGCPIAHAMAEVRFGPPKEVA